MNYSKLPKVHTSPISSSSRTPKPPKPLLWPTISLVLGMLWIIPALFVLQTNISRKIVGPSIGCLRSKCNLNFHSHTQIQQAQTLAKDDRNALAGLQIAAKLLDGWFCAIAASLVYTVLRLIAGRDSARPLPVGYIHVHTECADISSLQKLFWGRLHDARFESRKMRNQGWWARMRLYIFILFVAVVCILCNLMGPATAVLVIPNIQWTDINQAQNVWFEAAISDQPPQNAAIAPDCTTANLTVGNYSCTGTLYERATDAYIAAANAAVDQVFAYNHDSNARQHALLLPPIFQETNVSFTVNISDTVIWIPARQTIRELNADLTDWDVSTATDQLEPSDYPDSGYFNRSLQARLQQHGPVFGMQNSCLKSNRIVINPLANDKFVHCYQGPNSTKCFPFGTAWSNNISQAFTNFSIQNLNAPPSNISLILSVFTTSMSLEIYNSTFECIMSKNCTQDWKASWDWNTAFFGPQNQTNPPCNISGPQQTFVYTMPGFTKDNTTIWCDSQTVLGFADYVLDPDTTSNSIRLVELNMENTPTISSPVPLFVHPDWTLAAWSVNRNGTVAGTRGANRAFIAAIENWIYDSASPSATDFQVMHEFMALQTLSLIPYSTLTLKPTNTSSNPPLSRKAQIQVWKYDLNSDSAIFSIVILCLGCLCVLARTFLYTENMKDATEILELAMKRNSTPLLVRGQWHWGSDLEDQDDFPVWKVDSVSKKIYFHAAEIEVEDSGLMASGANSSA